jgi:hypothetical protein
LSILFSLAVVYYNSHSGLPWYYRVAGGWSDGGSLLLFSNLPYLILAPASPRVRVAQVSPSYPLPGLMLASVSCVLDRVHGVVEDLGLNPLLVSPRVYPCL